MNCLRCLSFGPYLNRLVLILGVLLVTACDSRTTPPQNAPKPDEVRTFTGTWTATGDRQTMQLDSGHQAVIFKLTGSLMLSGPQRPSRGFRAEIIGFSDTTIGMQGRSVWTDERGDKVFSTLHSDSTGSGKLIQASFLGGTGRYAGVSGEYSFRWRHLINNEDGVVSGRVVDLKGWARLGTPGNLPTTTGDKQ